MADKTTEQEQTAVRKRRPGRKPMTPEQREAAAKERAEKMAQAANMTPVVYVQYQDMQCDVAAIIAAAKDQFRQTRKRTLITDMKVYIKPEERAAYFVVNDTFDGKVEY